jgi:hypothetical protein
MGSIVRSHQTTRDWQALIEWMIDEGAVMTDEEFDRVLGYLSVRYGRVAVNLAPGDELRTVLELTDDQVRRLLAARTAGKKFLTLEDLAVAIDVAPAALAEREARIDFLSH